MHHFRKKRIKYSSLNTKDKKSNSGCSLCRAIANEEAMETGKTMVVLPNRVSYDVFEGKRTTGEHYMILPKRHLETINDFSDEEKIEMSTLAGKYELQGFNIYARGVGSQSRSQQHQHTHLIKLENKPTRFLLYLEKPYLVLHK